MPNYTKLFNSIITSTIWSEDDKTRIVWITMLALADQNGEVQGSVPGLARLAGVSVNDVESALDKFLSPDPYSRTPDFEGRRICKIDGGWELLNHAKYRRMASLADQKDSNAKRQKRHRERNATVTHRNASVTVETDKAEAEAEANTDNTKSISPKGDGIDIGKTRKELNSNLSEKAETIYSHYPRKVGKTAAIKAIVSAMKYESYEKLLETVKEYAEKIAWKEPQFIPHPSTWFNEGRFNDDPSEWNKPASPQKPDHRTAKKENEFQEKITIKQL